MPTFFVPPGVFPDLSQRPFPRSPATPHAGAVLHPAPARSVHLRRDTRSRCRCSRSVLASKANPPSSVHVFRAHGLPIGTPTKRRGDHAPRPDAISTRPSQRRRASKLSRRPAGQPPAQPIRPVSANTFNGAQRPGTGGGRPQPRPPRLERTTPISSTKRRTRAAPVTCWRGITRSAPRRSCSRDANSRRRSDGSASSPRDRHAQPRGGRAGWGIRR